MERQNESAVTEMPGGEGAAAWRAFITAHAVVADRIERELAREGLLPLSWYEVLLALAEAPERRLRMHELARAVALSRSGLTRLVDRLERAGLLCRENCPSDRRGSFAALTEEGLEALRRTGPAYERSIREHFVRHLDAEELRVMSGALERVLEEVRER
jgi:DNA-binding MarR family transcriptional regulator